MVTLDGITRSVITISMLYYGTNDVGQMSCIISISPNTVGLTNFNGKY